MADDFGVPPVGEHQRLDLGPVLEADDLSDEDPMVALVVGGHRAALELGGAAIEQGDTTLADMFEGADCEYCSDANWTVQKKNYD